MAMVPLPGLAEMVEMISRERNLPRHVVTEALREALLKGYERYRKTIQRDVVFPEDHFRNFEVELDVEAGGFRILATKTIVEQVRDPDHEISLYEVQQDYPEAEVGWEVTNDVTPQQAEFGRMAAIQTKQVLAQRLRDQQRRLIQEEFRDLEKTVLQARVLRTEGQTVIMAVSSGFGRPEVEAALPKEEQLASDRYVPNAVMKVYLKKVHEGSRRGPQLLVSRADAGLVVNLFANEVPEIEEDIVRIVAVAREANPPSRNVGPRTKIAVDTLERDVDPVGACIGAKGSRIQAVVAELRNEKIDVIRWSPDPATYIANALSPAKVVEVRLVDPEIQQAHVLVTSDQLSLAIGKEGQNVRLAARLTGWKIDIKEVESYRAALEEAQAQGLPYPFITPAALERFRRREKQAALQLEEEYPEKLRLEEELEADERLEEEWVEEEEDFDYDAEFDIAQPKA